MSTMIRQYGFSALLIALGLSLALGANAADQNSMVILGALSILIAGVVTGVATALKLNKITSWGLFFVLLAASGSMAYMDYASIKEKIDIAEEWDYREALIVQRLKDVRAAEQTYKTVKGKYAGSFDTLMHFLQHDSMMVIRAIGTVPDTMSEAEAVEAGIVSRDTSWQSPMEGKFMRETMKERTAPFVFDSLPYVPVSGALFALQAGEIERGKVQVQVFECRDTVPYMDIKELSVGSMSEPSIGGNWE